MLCTANKINLFSLYFFYYQSIISCRFAFLVKYFYINICRKQNILVWILSLLTLVAEETVVKLAHPVASGSMVGYNGGADGAFLFGLEGLEQVSLSSNNLHFNEHQ